MKTTRENHHYAASGLPYVTLVGLQVTRCADCGEFEVEIPANKELHQAIAVALIHKRPRFTPEEVRFLRTHLGKTGAVFAKLLGVTPSHVSRWENGHEPVSAMADRILRLMVVAATAVRDFRIEGLVELEDASAPIRLRAENADGRWVVRSA